MLYHPEIGRGTSAIVYNIGNGLVAKVLADGKCDETGRLRYEHEVTQALVRGGVPHAQSIGVRSINIRRPFPNRRVALIQKRAAGIPAWQALPTDYAAICAQTNQAYSLAYSLGFVRQWADAEDVIWNPATRLITLVDAYDWFEPSARRPREWFEQPVFSTRHLLDAARQHRH